MKWVQYPLQNVFFFKRYHVIIVSLLGSPWVYSYWHTDLKWVINRNYCLFPFCKSLCYIHSVYTFYSPPPLSLVSGEGGHRWALGGHQLPLVQSHRPLRLCSVRLTQTQPVISPYNWVKQLFEQSQRIERKWEAVKASVAECLRLFKRQTAGLLFIYRHIFI